MKSLKIALIHSRLGFTDGVSLEAEKWEDSFNHLGHKVFLIAGKFKSKPKSRFLEVKEANHLNDKSEKFRRDFFNKNISKYKITRLQKQIDLQSSIIKSKILQYLLKNKIEVLMITNVLSLPVNIPLSVALKEIIEETKIPTIVQSHDFYWEREKYKQTSFSKKILDPVFPPKLKNVFHITINKRAQKELRKKKGISSKVMYNKFRFKVKTNSNKKIRKDIRLKEDELLFLQPTRFLRRKNIERSIVLVEKINKLSGKDNLLLVTSREKNNYRKEVERFAKKHNVRLLAGRDMYGHNIDDLYKISDIVTFPSDIEGFGNPVIESCVHKKPLFVNNYPILKEILNYKFKFFVITGKVTDKVAKRIYELLKNKKETRRMADYNHKIAKKHFSFDKLYTETKDILSQIVKK